MTTIASQITSLTVVYSTVYSEVDQRKHQSSASLAFVWGIHRDRWIPRTKGQLRGKCFHLMTSSWWPYFIGVKWASRHPNLPVPRLFVQEFLQAGGKGNTKAPHHCPFVWGIHRSPVDSPHKGPLLRKAFPCHSVVMTSDRINTTLVVLKGCFAGTWAAVLSHCYILATVSVK